MWAGSQTGREHRGPLPTGTAILSYFTLPNSNREHKRSPNEKIISTAEVSPSAAQSTRSLGPPVVWAWFRAVPLGNRAMNFASDNAAGVAPDILAAIGRANEGAALAYGSDAWTRRVEARFAELFEREVAVF